ncbi:hypothetical protein MXD61_16285, partial [Frankia sp. AgPm24]|nr:hypothetical protein [Frankia sp. AgPm24]
VYRPISEVLAEIDERTPPVRFPTALPHSHTGQSRPPADGQTQRAEPPAGHGVRLSAVRPEG